MKEQFKFDINACNVKRTEDQNYLISWRGSQPGSVVKVYMAESPEQFYAGGDLGSPVLQTQDLEISLPNPDASVRHYFFLHCEQGEGIALAERQLFLEGTPNFRDLGGYETICGRRLRWGKLFRSGKLSRLTDADIQFINQLDVSLVCDFRQEMEQEIDPTWLGHDHPAIFAGLPIAPGGNENFMTNLLNGIIEIDDAAGFMEKINRQFVISHMHQYAQMFKLLLEGDQQMLIHCASGKDRTGFGAALILDVLGVLEDTIIEDYLLTNTYLPVDKEVDRLSKHFTDRSGSNVSEEILRPMVEVRPQYLIASFDEIKSRYESKEHFYEYALDLDATEIELLKSRYLV